jgi:hypothetical protein
MLRLFSREYLFLTSCPSFLPFENSEWERGIKRDVLGGQEITVNVEVL